MERTQERHVLVTGASSGIGRATVLHLARSGFHVFAGVRQPDDGYRLEAESTGRISPIQLDVTSTGDIARAAADVEAVVRDDGLVGIVNNAGEGFPGPLEILPIDDLREQLEVNVIGQVAVTQRFLPLLRRATSARIVFVGSIGGKLAVQFAGAYHASKYAMEAIADSWRQELLDDSIEVTIIEPGTVSTEIWRKAIQQLDELRTIPGAIRYDERLEEFRRTLHFADKNGMPAAKVAEVVEKALTEDRPSSRYPVGAAARIAYRARPLIPDRVFDKIATRVTGNGRKDTDAE